MNNFTPKPRTRQDFEKAFNRLLRSGEAFGRKSHGGRLPPKYEKLLNKGDFDNE